MSRDHRPLWKLLLLGIAGLALVAAVVGIRPFRHGTGFLARSLRTLDFDLHPRIRVRGAGTPSPLEMTRASGAAGPLRVLATNPRYFTDGTGRAILLAGSHTWSSLQDNGGSYPPPRFDYDRYLDFLVENDHNFFRLWSWEQARWTVETSDDNYWFDPLPYRRTGPGVALDGRPKFDLTLFDQRYFDRLRQRVAAAGARGIYVSIMLFDGWSIEANKGEFAKNNPWRGHPFNRHNNVNGVDGDLNGDDSGSEVHTLLNPAVTALQEAYVRKVIETVNPLDNVLYEIANESHAGSTPWQYHMVRLVKSCEAATPKRHPVGMTVAWPGGSLADLYQGPADWVSPSGDVQRPPVGDGTKVILADTDHLGGIVGDRRFVWKSVANGLNPIFMDGYDGAGYGVGAAGFVVEDAAWASLRRNLGYAVAYANRMRLADMRPRPDLSSTGYCLANPAEDGTAALLVYLPAGGEAVVDLSTPHGELRFEWLDPSRGLVYSSGTTTGGGYREFSAPFAGDAVLRLWREPAAPSSAASRVRR